MGSLRRTTPVSEHWGTERGTPLDRFYIESFLKRNRSDISGRVLEVLDRRYTERFGTGVSRTDILDINADNAKATLIQDLATPVSDSLEDRFDCFLLIQTLQFIYNYRTAIENARRLLRSGGVLLVTVPVISKLDPNYDDCWRFTPHSFRTLLSHTGWSDWKIETPGNVLTGIAFLAGIAAEELKIKEVETIDPLYPLLILARVVK